MANGLISVDMKEYRRRIKRLHRYYYDAYAKSMNAALTRIGVNQVGQMKAASPRYTGKLANSHAWVVDPQKQTLVIFNRDTKKALWLHEGTHHTRMPPPKALQRWCKRKLGNAGLAYVVARSILERGGLVARKWMEAVFTRQQPVTIATLSKAVDTTLAEVERKL